MQKTHRQKSFSIFVFAGLLCFFAVMLTVAVLVCLLDASSPDYMSGTPLVLEREDTIMSVHNILQPDDTSIELSIISIEPCADLALVVSNSTAISVWQDEAVIYTTSPEDTYKRAQIVPLRPVEGESHIRMTFSTLNPSNRPTNHILLGTRAHVEERVNYVTVLNTFFLGILVMMIVSSSILYLQKRSESYLLYLTITTVLSLISLCLTFPIPGINSQLSFVRTYNLRAAMLAVCQWLFLLVLTKLYPGHVTSFVHRARYILLCVAFAIALSTATGTAPAALSYFYRLMVAPVAAVHLCDALYRRKNDALLVLLAYAAMEGICFGSYYAADRLHYGVLFGFFRVVEVAQAGFLIAVTAVVNLRFAQHFRRAEALQRELAQLNATLEAKVEERTHDLKEQQKRRQTIMQNIFHDLRSPLIVLRSQVEQMPDTEPSKPLLDQRISYMQRLTEELFLVSNLESHNVIFDEDDVDVYALARHVSNGISAVAAQKQIRVSCTGESAIVWGDALRLEQAIQNLADNALHHTPAGGSIALSVHAEGKHAVIRMHNTGSFISAQDIPLVFERYYRSRRRHDPHSSGLGLSIAKEIIEAHEGCIFAESDEHSGTTFIIRISLL